MLKGLFPANEHKIERAIRILLGLALLALAFIGPKTYWGYVGFIPLITGALGSCPLYILFGISTCKRR